MNFKDHFSTQAVDYARYRPSYPDALFAYLASLPRAHDTALDCGTGSGQAALGLAAFFTHVIATDPSEKQIANAAPHARVSYRVASAEDSGLPAASVDLVTAAQAVHWFDFDRFYREVRRVLKPGGAVAVWCYGLFATAPAVDRIVHDYYARIVGPFWPPERRIIEDAYRSIPFPFVEVVPPDFHMQARWDLADLFGYLGTWSATQAYLRQHGVDPRALIETELAQAWGDAAVPRPVRWPVHLRVGRCAPVE